MRILTPYEICSTSGGFQPGESNYDNFWNSFFMAAGSGAGYLCSLPLALGMAVYGVVYYAVYTPIYYAAAGVGLIFSGAINGVAGTVNVAMGRT